jgi:undecaprenyl-phosphate alpha-N-acetylglucosaminyl 1-phosphatetransferase
MRLILAFASVLLLTAACVPLLKRLAPALGLVDVPDERKQHAVPTPLVGGVAIFLGLGLTALWLLATGWLAPSPPVLSLLVGGSLMVIVGAIDDARDLSPGVRFAAQAAAALLMIFGGGVVLTDLGGMTPSGETLALGWLAAPFTIFATIGIINALNMCDGLDGLSGSLALVSLSGLFVAAVAWGTPLTILPLAMLAAAVVGFLAFNLRLPGRARASVFMGDAGSMFLGFALTWFTVSMSQGEDRALPPAAALWFLMVPIFDTVTMMLRRILRGRSPFSPDREHLHHVFLLAGFSVNQTVALMAGLNALGGLVGLAAVWFRWPELWVALGFLLAGLGYFWMIMRAWRVMRFLHRSICRRRISADRRRCASPAYAGPERRTGVDRRLRPVEGRLPREAGSKGLGTGLARSR